MTAQTAVECLVVRRPSPLWLDLIRAGSAALTTVAIIATLSIWLYCWKTGR